MGVRRRHELLAPVERGADRDPAQAAPPQARGRTRVRSHRGGGHSCSTAGTLSKAPAPRAERVKEPSLRGLTSSCPIVTGRCWTLRDSVLSCDNRGPAGVLLRSLRDRELAPHRQINSRRKVHGPESFDPGPLLKGPSHPSAVVHQRDGILSAPGSVTTAAWCARSTGLHASSARKS